MIDIDVIFLEGYNSAIDFLYLYYLSSKEIKLERVSDIPRLLKVAPKPDKYLLRYFKSCPKNPLFLIMSNSLTFNRGGVRLSDTIKVEDNP